MSSGENYLLPQMDMAKVGGRYIYIYIGCEALYFHAMCKSRVSVSGWPPIGCECFRTDLNMSTPHYFSLPKILSVNHIVIVILIVAWGTLFEGCTN